MTNDQFSRAVHDYADTVYRVALNYLKNPHNAEDVTQEVFLRLYRTAKVPEVGEHTKAWLIRVTINECRRQLTSPWSKVMPLEEWAETQDFSSVEKREVYEAVMSLPAKYRIAVYLHYYEGYTAAETGSFLGISTSAVCSRLERARNRLKIMLTEGENV